MVHVQTIIGLLNLITILVTNSRNDHLREPVFQAQKGLAQLSPNGQGEYVMKSGPARTLLSQVLDRADSLLALQSNGALIRALDYMDRSFLGETGAEVVSLTAAAVRPTTSMD